MTPGTIAQLACVLEVTARKPGNVHRFVDFRDATYLDFLLSAQAIAGPLERAAGFGIGRTVLDCVRESRRFVATNTNLGMILLLAPLASVSPQSNLREGVQEILAGTTIDDARLVYEAIRLAQPGSMGKSGDQDIAEEPTETLLDAMRLAADRDSIARQYAHGFADLFDVVLPCLRKALDSGRNWESAVVQTHLFTLARIPDTLILRKRGRGEADSASAAAREVLDAGWPDQERGLIRFEEFDAWLRAEGHSRNPGATADLVAAALFAALRDGIITFPLATDGPPSG